MAKIEYELQGDFNRILSELEAVMNENSLVSKEGSSDIVRGSCRLAVRVYEQYEAEKDKYTGVNITLVQDSEKIRLSVIVTNEGMTVDTDIYNEGILKLLENAVKRYILADEWGVTW